MYIKFNKEFKDTDTEPTLMQSIKPFVKPFFIITISLVVIVMSLNWLCGGEFKNFIPDSSNVQHHYSMWSGHTKTETIIIDGKKFIKFTDNKGRTSLTQVIE